MQKHIKLTMNKIKDTWGSFRIVNILTSSPKCSNWLPYCLIHFLNLEEMDLETYSNILFGICAHSFSIATLILAIVLSFLLQTLSFRSCHAKKFTGVKSGKLGEYLMVPLLTNHLFCISLFR